MMQPAKSFSDTFSPTGSIDFIRPLKNVEGNATSLSHTGSKSNRGERTYTSMNDIGGRYDTSTNPFRAEQTYLKTPLPRPPSPDFRNREYLQNAFSSPDESYHRSTPTLAGIIGTIPHFTGESDENIDLFISHFERAARSGHWNNDIRLSVLTSRLKGKALRTYNEGIGLLLDVSYEDTRDHLIGLYRSKETKIEKTEKFFRSFQKSEENVEAYFFRIRGLSNAIGGDPNVMNELLLKKFIDGLRVDIARQVIMHNPRNIVDALHKAKEVESVENRIGRRIKKVASISGDTQVHQKVDNTYFSQIEDLRKEVGALALQMKREDGREHTPAIIICDHCHGTAHTERRCPQKLRDDILLN